MTRRSQPGRTEEGAPGRGNRKAGAQDLRGIGVGENRRSNAGKESKRTGVRWWLTGATRCRAFYTRTGA